MIGSEENVIVEHSQLYSKRVITAIAGLQGNLNNSNGNNNLLFQRNGSLYMTFNIDKVEINQPLHLANELVIGTAFELQSNTIDSNGDNDFSFQRNGVEFFKLTSATNSLVVANTSFIFTPRV